MQRKRLKHFMRKIKYRGLYMSWNAWIHFTEDKIQRNIYCVALRLGCRVEIDLAHLTVGSTTEIVGSAATFGEANTCQIAENKTFRRLSHLDAVYSHVES